MNDVARNALYLSSYIVVAIVVLCAVSCIQYGTNSGTEYTLVADKLIPAHPVNLTVSDEKDTPSTVKQAEELPLYLAKQRARNVTIREICGPKGSIRNLTTMQAKYVLEHTIVDDVHRLMYCVVSKVACSNWKRVMQVLSGHKYSRVEDIDKVHLTHFSFLSSYSPEEIDYRLNNYFKFMFVRHPLDRLFSAWHNRFQEHFPIFQKTFGVQIVKQFRENAPADPKGDDVTLVEFFKYLAATKVSQFNAHWMPFVEGCQPCYVDYNYIGMFEDLENEAKTLIEHLKLSSEVTYPTRQHYYDKNSVSEETKKDEWRKVPPELFQEVIKKYTTDFRLYGYPIPESIEEYISDWIQ